MIEEEAWVASVENGRVWIEKQRKSACSGCQQTCASSVTAGLFAAKTVRIPVFTGQPLQVGDKVVVGIRESALVLASARIYLLPLLALIAGALMGKIAGATDPFVALAGLAGLVLYLLVFRTFSHTDSVDLRPVILRKIN
ncbi:SoxR reducing system RseC family protein [Methylococcus sp. EFPC2]|uniref:SoxR reducing system RseC family protein n=1 Tax=Methylococcus sp. EFPC2 TaxID=2812648 RepID=UPI0019671129|nr:SoxR reducing system RseC family protein [Methylococcus sp. EFPC2]QSA98345.1 SoxR reducing system RseC family protein [Methylococcus sp. EFPC2]